MTVRYMRPVYPGDMRRNTGGASPSRQVQDWTRGMEAGSAGRRRVITEKRTALPAFSAGGIRLDILQITLALLLLVFVCVLFADVEALYSGGDRIGKLNAGIASLEDSNAALRSRLSTAMRHPVLLRKADSSDTENSFIIVRSTIPEPEE